MNALQPKKDSTAPKELGKPLVPATQVNRVRFSIDGKLLAAACFDGTVKRWAVGDKEPTELDPITGHNGWVTDLAFGVTQLFTVDSWGEMKAWLLREDSTVVKPRWSVPAAHDGWLRAISYHPRATAVATCGRDGFVRVWGRLRGEKWDECDIKADVLSVCFAVDGGSVFAGDLFGIVREIVKGKVSRTLELTEMHTLDRIRTWAA